MGNAHLIRTLVFVGGHDPDRIRSIAESGPDAVCIDLEDSTPVRFKDQARAGFRDAAKVIASAGAYVFARTNVPSAGMADDLEACMCPELHCLSVPKVESAPEVVDFVAMVEDAEQRHGLAAGSVLVRPIIETAQGVRMAYDIAAASPRVAYLGGVEGGVFGDLGGQLGYQQTDTGAETMYLRSKILIDVRAAGVPFPIGGGTTARKDSEGARAFAAENRMLGYSGVHCGTTPEMIAASNEVFTPSREDLDGWLEIMPTLEAAEAEGLHVAHVGNKVYDLIGLIRVREQLVLARKLGIID
jgi:citrate lyase subunit beta/citryl-CoA lyase